MEARAVVVLDFEGRSSEELAARVKQLGFQAHRARDIAQARALVTDSTAPVAVLFLPPEPPGPELRTLLDELPSLPPGFSPGVVAVGPEPDPAVRSALREAGVHRALWEPFDDGSLRFVVSEELTDPEELGARIEPRVPTTLFARIQVGGRRKEALVYNLSASGVYLETPRPSMRGAHIRVELPLPDGEVEAEALVVYTNVPGNLHRPLLPFGMGARFTDLDPTHAERLRSYVHERLHRFEV